MMERDFILDDHECMAGIRLAELTKAVDRLRLGRAVTGSVLGIYGAEGERDLASRCHRVLIYRVADGEPIFLVRIPDKGKPTIHLPLKDGGGFD